MEALKISLGAAAGNVLTSDSLGVGIWQALPEGDGSGWVDDGTVVRLDAIGDSVGIGTMSPSTKLDVVGDAKVSGKMTIGPDHTNTGVNAFVAGHNNTVNDTAATIGGGRSNTANNKLTTIGGGEFNIASGRFATVGGGINNRARGPYSVIAGGGDVNADSNSTQQMWATISGGRHNLALGQSSVIGGGGGNVASGSYVVVGGGQQNTADGDISTVCGGAVNVASGNWSVVSGGGDMWMSGGNIAAGDFSVISGGRENNAAGINSVIPGGRANSALGGYSFAAGRRAKAEHAGTFVWADSTNTDFISTGANQFLIRASGGVGIGTTSPTAKLDVEGSSTSQIAKVINTEGGAALRAESYGTSSNTIYGTYNFAENTTGTGYIYGSYSRSRGTSSNMVLGTYGEAENPGAGRAYGGYFEGSGPSGTGNGNKFGLYAEGNDNSAIPTYGTYGYAENSGTGRAYGGYFDVPAFGSGEHYGIKATSYGASDSTTCGTYGYTSNSGLGMAFGGFFMADSSGGMGNHWGVQAIGMGETDFPAYVAGVSGVATDYGEGGARGGEFWTTIHGEGTHYGVLAISGAGSPDSSIGTYGHAENTGSGEAIGGYFRTTSAGTGEHIGLNILSEGSSSSPVTGVKCIAQNTGTGVIKAGLFTVTDSDVDADTIMGVGASCSGASDSYPIYGISGYASNTGESSIYGVHGSATASLVGTGYGVYGMEASGGSGAAVYAAGDQIASGTKSAVVRTTTSGHRLCYTMESPEVWFEDVGEGQLIAGKARIELDPLFLETVTINANHPMKVFIQLEGDCKGTYVQKGDVNFDVIELQGGTSNAAFSYRVLAKRKGYETERHRLTDVGNDDPNLYPELWAGIEKRQEEQRLRERIGGTGEPPRLYHRMKEEQLVKPQRMKPPADEPQRENKLRREYLQHEPQGKDEMQQKRQLVEDESRREAESRETTLRRVNPQMGGTR
jgi:hypothetical protein